MMALPLTVAAATQAQTALYVTPDGNDAQPGTKDAPLATLAGARDRIRTLKPATPVTVEFAPGTYRFANAAEFAEQDSGRNGAAITYRAAEGAEVRLTGGFQVSAWAPVTDPDIRNRLAENARDKIRVADLTAQGITDLGKLSVRGFAMGSPPAEAELFYNDKPMTLARWPNEGFRGIEKRTDLQHVVLDTDRLKRWTDEPDPWIFAYWHHDWAEIYEPIVGIDPETHTIERSKDVKPRYGITAGRARWYALNLLSELDTPGEYYIDRTAGKAYFWPPEDGGRTTVSVADGIIRGENLSHVTFRGFTIEACRSSAVALSGGTQSQVVGCTIRNTGHRAVVVSGGTRHTVYGCDVYYCGEGGISMSGGDRPTLTPAGHNAENNHVHHYSRRARTYKTGITVAGVGNRMAHNLVHHGPHMALSAPGNNHVVEYNDIHNAVYESGDAGAFYVGRDWTQRGNILRYNYWHEIVGATGHGGMTIYLDDQHSGYTIFGNVFEHCSRAVFIGGGDDNTVVNNVFVKCWKAAHVDNRGMGWQKKATDAPNGTLRTRLRAMPYKNDLWSREYPNLVNILEDDPNIPKRNVFRSNVSAGGLWDDIHKGTRKYQTVEDNLVFDNQPDWITLVKDDRGNLVDIRFKDPQAVKAIGFEPIPVEKIGLYQDERRASWPVDNPIDTIKLPDAPKPAAPRKQANLPPNPTFQVPKQTGKIDLDGKIEKGEWATDEKLPAMKLLTTYEGALVDNPPTVWINHDGTNLRVAVQAPLPKKRAVDSKWGSSDAVELAFRAADGPNADTLLLRGFATGKWLASPDAGAAAAATAELAERVRFAADVADNVWSAEWIVPLDALGVVPGDRIRFNCTVRRTGTNEWIMWRPTNGNSFLVERVGTLELAE
jgi:hypothetical protein